MKHEFLLPEAGGFRHLRSFILARLCYDITIHFCELYIPASSRTRDQMEQAARSGVQNIAEGSAASATSKETEIKLTNVAKASLQELTLDYEDFLRQHQQAPWGKEEPLYRNFIQRRISDRRAFKAFIADALAANPEIPKEFLVARGMLLLLRAVDYLLSRQLQRLSEDFIDDGGFHERMTRFRMDKRNRSRWQRGK